MKLLFDQNLSPKLVNRLADLFPDSTHVQSAGLDCADDDQVWQYAKQAIVTKDEDYNDLSVVRGSPPKVLWLQTGNCTTAQGEAVFQAHFADIEAFEKDPAAGTLVGANTGDLEAIAAWLTDCGVTTIAMESTGVYWIPLYELLASRGFDVILVDPRKTKHAPGRPKSDVLDCQWIRRLHSYGLLTASFRPADEIVVWRGYQRQREMLVRYAAQHIQHMQKALEEMNVKLTEVVSDIVGQTGMKIIKDIVRGKHDARELAKHRHERCKATEAAIASALYGNWRKEHLFALKQMYEFYQRQLRACDKEIETCLRGFADQSGGAALPPSARRLQPRRNESRFGAQRRIRRLGTSVPKYRRLAGKGNGDGWAFALPRWYPLIPDWACLVRVRSGKKVTLFSEGLFLQVMA